MIAKVMILVSILLCAVVISVLDKVRGSLVELDVQYYVYAARDRAQTCFASGSTQQGLYSSVVR